MSTSSAPPSPEEGPFDTVAVLGLGVIGGSLARALCALTDPPEVRGWSPSAPERGAAAASGAAGTIFGRWEEAVDGADLIVLATPLAAACALLPDVGLVAGSRATLSDVASLKAPLDRASRAAGLTARWVGCHPMAGSEATGFEAARDGLFQDARVWLCAAPEAEARAGRVADLWSRLGGRPERVDAVEHDERMVLVSHLPQLVANALAETLAARGVAAGDLGPGGRDATRLAASSPEMWRDLLEHAPPGLAEALVDVAGATARWAAMIESGSLDELEAVMGRTRAWRRA